MWKFVRFGLGSSLLAVASLTSTVGPALADLSGPAPYEIEAKEQYCADRSTNCAQPNQPPNLNNLRFALVEVYRVTPATDNGNDRDKGKGDDNDGRRPAPRR
ncbi:MAG: hypothetical protein JO352_23030 [Chloroflexi bacterium]|nr:hypothetical protein [Chloroflexota bacterium]MBV9597679.1 hypothetical protein [Chloroflexota bacterium]